MEVINLHRDDKDSTLEQMLLRWNRINEVAEMLGAELKSWEQFCMENNLSQAILDAGKEATDESA